MSHRWRSVNLDHHVAWICDDFVHQNSCEIYAGCQAAGLALLHLGPSLLSKKSIIAAPGKVIVCVKPPARCLKFGICLGRSRRSSCSPHRCPSLDGDVIFLDQYVEKNPQPNDIFPADPLSRVACDGEQRSGGRPIRMALCSHGGHRRIFLMPTFLCNPTSLMPNPLGICVRKYRRCRRPDRKMRRP